MSRFKIMVLLLLAGLLISTPALAQPDTFEHLSPTEISDLLARLEQPFVVKKTRSGTALHVLTFGKVKTVLHGLLCKQESCRMLRLSAVFSVHKPTLDIINNWNSKHRFSRAYIDSDGDVMLVSDLDLDGGVTDHDAMIFIEGFGHQAEDLPLIFE